MRGAAAGVVAVALFAASGPVIGDRPPFDASGAEVAAFFDASSTRIQLGCVLAALSAPLLVWFLATVATIAGADGPEVRRTAAVGLGCGLAFVALLMVDVTSLAVGALRPEDMLAAPELAAALVSFEFLLMATATPLAVAMLAAFATLALRHAAVWPRWVGWLALAAALAYSLRIGTYFSADGAFAADGLVGFWVPVAAIIGWIAVAGSRLALSRGPRP